MYEDNKYKKYKEYFEVNSDFALGKMSLEEYLRKRNTSEKQKYKDMKYFSRHSYLFNSLLSKLPIGIRLKVCLYLHDLKIDDIKSMGLTKPDIYISDKYPIGIEKGVSYILIDLAIILDLPYEFVTSKAPRLLIDGKTSFREYDNSLTVEVHPFKEIMAEALKVPKKREIRGFLCNEENSVLPKILNECSIIRLDKRDDFVCVEIFTNSITDVDATWIRKITPFFKNELMYIYLSDALLRNCYKITFLSKYIDTRVEEKNLDIFASELSKRERYIKIYPF